MSEHHVNPIGLLWWFMGWARLALLHFLGNTNVSYKGIEP
jgi:hypothetical protein